MQREGTNQKLHASGVLENVRAILGFRGLGAWAWAETGTAKEDGMGRQGITR